ncbi:hypothetical protein TKK_0015436 [Trichogramma kaykai]
MLSKLSYEVWFKISFSSLSQSFLYEEAIYLLKQIYVEIVKIENALLRGDYEYLKLVLSESEKVLTRVDPSKVNEISLDENELKNIYRDGIKIHTAELVDTPIIPCIPYSRLFRSSSVKAAEDLFTTPTTKQLIVGGPVENELIQSLKLRCGPNGLNGKYVCTNCFKNIKKNVIPSMSVLNNLSIVPLPNQLLALNDFEKTLIQRAKAFQRIYTS